MNLKTVNIIGSGAYLPGEAIPLSEVDRVLGTFDQAPVKIRRWMERLQPMLNELLEVDHYHFAIDPKTGAFTDDNITMSVKAAQQALERAGLRASDIDLIVYGSAHQDQMPAASVRIQAALGIERCAEIAVHANCTSAYKALQIANDMLRLGRYKTALVISSGMSSSEMRASYYNQQLVTREQAFLRYFLGDGAGALVLEATDKRDGASLLATYIESAGGIKPSAMFNGRPAYWMNPKDEFEKGAHHLNQLINDELQKHFFDTAGTSIFFKGLQRMLESEQFDINNTKYFQVNFPSKHISETLIEECQQLGVKKEWLYTSMSDMGYAGPPMAFITLDKILRDEPLHNGDGILSFVTEVSKFMQAGYYIEMSE